jgi:hypothetical protein
LGLEEVETGKIAVQRLAIYVAQLQRRQELPPALAEEVAKRCLIPSSSSRAWTRFSRLVPIPTSASR